MTSAAVLQQQPQPDNTVCHAPPGLQVAQLFAHGLLCVRSWSSTTGRAQDLPGFLMPTAASGPKLGKRKAGGAAGRAAAQQGPQQSGGQHAASAGAMHS
jgi:hypothetical protein